MAANVAGHSAIPLCWGGFPEGPGYGVASWGGVRSQRYVICLCFVIYVVDILVHMF
jgi:hypothetical protein